MKLGSDVAGTGHTDPKSAAAGVQNADRGILHNIDRSVELIAVDAWRPARRMPAPIPASKYGRSPIASPASDSAIPC
jgi:hypothetical protein